MNTASSEQEKELTDSEVRELVLARLSVLSPDTAMSIGNEGTFTRDDLIRHVKDGDPVGATIERMELEWLRAMKEGIVQQLS